MATAASTTTLLPAALESSLQEVIARANHSAAGIKAILLSTTEGVPLGRCIGANNNNNNGESSLHEDVLATIESVWAPASKQFPVLGLSKLLQVTAIYDHGVLMHVYLGPVVVTILCCSNCNIGAVRSTAIPLIRHVLEPLCVTLVKSLNVQDETTPGTRLYQ